MALPLCKRPLAIISSLSTKQLSPNCNTLLPRRIPWAQHAYISNVHPFLPDVTPNPKTNAAKLATTTEDTIDDRGLRVDPRLRPLLARARLSKALQSMYLRPLKRKPTHGGHDVVCDLQLRSFSIGNLDLFADFAMRCAYYLGLPALGPIPLPHITNRYTVIRANFVHKKSQENFERIHLRRLIQIRDADPVAVQCWLGYLQKKQYHGVGMKANIWEHEGLGVGQRMDETADKVDDSMDEEWGNIGIRLNATTADKVEQLMDSEAFLKPRRDIEAYYREPVEVKRER